MKLNTGLGRYSIAFCYGFLLALMPILASESPSFFNRMLGKTSRLQQKMKGFTNKLFGGPKYAAAYQVLDAAPAQVYIVPHGPVPIQFSPPPAGVDFRQPAPSPRYEDSRGPPPTAPYHGAPKPSQPDDVQRSAAPMQYQPTPNAAQESNNDGNEAEFQDAEYHFDDREVENAERAAGHHDDHNYQDDDNDDHADHNNQMDLNHHRQTLQDDEYDREHESGHVPDDHTYAGEQLYHEDADRRPSDEEEKFEGDYEADDRSSLHLERMQSHSSEDQIDHSPKTEEDNHDDLHPEENIVAQQSMVNGRNDYDDDDDTSHDDSAQYDYQHSQQSDDGGDDEGEKHLPKQENLHPDGLQQQQADFQEYSGPGQILDSAVVPSQKGYQEPDPAFDDDSESNVDHENHEEHEDHDDHEDHEERDVTKPVDHHKNDGVYEPTVPEGADFTLSKLTGHSQSRQGEFDASDKDDRNRFDPVQLSDDDQTVVPEAEVSNRKVQTLDFKDSLRPGTDPILQGGQFAKRKRGRSKAFEEKEENMKPEHDFDIKNRLQTEFYPIYKHENEAEREASLESVFQDGDEFSNVGPEMENLDEPDDFEEQLKQLIPIDTFEVVEKFVDEPPPDSEPINGEGSSNVGKESSDELPSAYEPETPHEDPAIKVYESQDLEETKKLSVARPSESKHTDEKETSLSERENTNLVESLKNGRDRDKESPTDKETEFEPRRGQSESILDNFVDDQEHSFVAESFDEEAMKVGPKESRLVHEDEKQRLSTESISEESVDDSRESHSDQDGRSDEPGDSLANLAPNGGDKSLDHNSQSTSGSGDDADRMVGQTESARENGKTILTPSISAALIPEVPEQKQKASGGIGFEFAEPAKFLPETSGFRVSSPLEIPEPREKKPSHEKEEDSAKSSELSAPKSIDKPERHFENHPEELPRESSPALDETHYMELNDDDRNLTTIDESLAKRGLSAKLEGPSRVSGDTGLGVSETQIPNESPYPTNENSHSNPKLKSINVDEPNDELPQEDSNNGKHGPVGNRERIEDPSSLIHAHNAAPKFELDNRFVTSIHDLPHQDKTASSDTHEDEWPNMVEVDRHLGYPVFPRNPDSFRDPDSSRDPESPQDPESPRNPESSQDPESPRNPDSPRDPESPRNPDSPRDPDSPQNPDSPRDPDSPQDPESSSHRAEDRPNRNSSTRVGSPIYEQPHEEKTAQPVEDSQFESARERARTLNEDDTADNSETRESYQDEKLEHPLGEAANAEDQDETNQLDKKRKYNVPRLNRSDSFLGRDSESREIEKTQPDDGNNQVPEDKAKESQDKNSNDSMASSDEIKAELALMPLPPMLDAKGLEMTKERRFKNGSKLNTNRNRIPKLNHRLSIETGDWNPKRELISRREGKHVKSSNSATENSQILSKNSGQLAEIVANTIGNSGIETIAYRPKRLSRGQ